MRGKIAIFIVCFAVLAMPIYAETTYIDAQKWTTCNNGQCQTIVPLNQFMNQGLITALKAIDLTPAKPVLTNKLLNFDYSFSGNNMIFTGHVSDTTYWTFNLGNSFVIDPYWWNYTAYVVENASNSVLALPFDENTGVNVHDRSGLGNDGIIAGALGWTTGVYDTQIVSDANSEYVNFTDSASIDVTGSHTWCWWMTTSADDDTIYANRQNGGAYVGYQIAIGAGGGGNAHKLTFDATGMASSNIPSITSIDDGKLRFTCVVFDSANTSIGFYFNATCDVIKNTGNGTLPSYTTKYLGINQALTATSTFIGTIDEFQIWNTTLTTADMQRVMDNAILKAYNNYYDNALTLNGEENNVTFANNTELNATGVVNMTGATVLIYINGTLSANDTDSATNSTLLPAGLYNVTGWFGNASANSTITHYANVTQYYPPPAVTVNFTYTMCSDNNTLFIHNTGFLNGTFNYTDEYKLCFNGCDNVTKSCEPEEYQQNMMNFGIILFIIIGISLVYRWSRR